MSSFLYDRSEGEKMIVNFKEMLEEARSNNYAVPHFNINNLEWAKYILETMQELQRPVILGVSEGAKKYMGGFLTVRKMVEGLIEELSITIPVCLHLDHGSSFEVCKEAIDAGFLSVMIDASRFELPKNVEITKQVVDMLMLEELVWKLKLVMLGERRIIFMVIIIKQLWKTVWHSYKQALIL